MSDLILTIKDRDDLASILDAFCADLEADITSHTIAGTEDQYAPEDAEFVAGRKALWRRVQDWMIKIDPEQEFDPARPIAVKSIP
jgi:hypothetical protein